MHDDQHGTAIISAAALLNALELAEKSIEVIRIVVSGAAAMSCLDLYEHGHVRQPSGRIHSKGHINTGREGLDASKQRYANDRRFDSLEAAMKDADVFLGLSKAGWSSRPWLPNGQKSYRFRTGQSRTGHRLRRCHGSPR